MAPPFCFSLQPESRPKSYVRIQELTGASFRKWRWCKARRSLDFGEAPRIAVPN